MFKNKCDSPSKYFPFVGEPRGSTTQIGKIYYTNIKHFAIFEPPILSNFVVNKIPEDFI